MADILIFPFSIVSFRVAGFELIKKIDEGGFGQVFKVSKDNQIAAMKIESNSQEGGSAIKLEV